MIIDFTNQLNNETRILGTRSGHLLVDSQHLDPTSGYNNCLRIANGFDQIRSDKYSQLWSIKGCPSLVNHKQWAFTLALRNVVQSRSRCWLQIGLYCLVQMYAKVVVCYYICTYVYIYVWNLLLSDSVVWRVAIELWNRSANIFIVSAQLFFNSYFAAYDFHTWHSYIVLIQLRCGRLLVVPHGWRHENYPRTGWYQLLKKKKTISKKALVVHL